MKDSIPKGTGNSRKMRSALSAGTTWDQALTQLRAGTFPFDFAGINETGWAVLGTALNKATLLSDETASALGLSGDPTVDDALGELAQNVPTAELHVLAGSGITVTITKGSKTLSARAGSDGWAILHPAEFGEWTVRATIGGNEAQKVFDINAIAVFYMAIATLESMDWSVISDISEAGLARKLWEIGDTKTVSVNNVNYTARIIGFDHDTKTAGGKAGITFQLVDCLATKYHMNSAETNVGGWKNSAMRTSTMPTLLGQLPTALKNAIKAVNKISSVGKNSSDLETTSDKLFLLSEIEIFGFTAHSYVGEGAQYEYYAAGNSTVKKVNGSAYYWWERSPYSGDTQFFCFVQSNGSASGSYSSNPGGVSFGFCV